MIEEGRLNGWEHKKREMKREAVFQEDAGNPPGLPDMRYQGLLDCVPYPTVIFTLDGVVSYLNPAFTNVFGWTLEELEGKKIPYVPPQLQKEANEKIEALLEKKTLQSYETKRLLKDGRVVDVITNGTILSKSEGEFYGELVILRDITQEKKIASSNEAMLRISMSLPKYPDLDDLLDYISDEIKRLLGTEGGIVILIDEVKNELFFPGASYDNKSTQKKVKEIRFPIEHMDQVVAEKVMKTGAPIIVLDTCKVSKSYPIRDEKVGRPPSNFIQVPLKSGDRIIGALAAINKKEGRFEKSDVELLSMVAGAVVLSVENARFSDELKKAYREIKQLKDRLQAENIYLREEIELKYKHGEIIGQSDSLKHVLSQAEQVAPTDSTVLILGETGTGKELLAQEIHNLSSRKDRSMVKVNCAALPSTLVESELFGREKGAYTGALSKQLGRFEVADGSTIFLDEISELPLDLQAKLLRVLQDGRFERLGSSKTIDVDVRIIAATNRDLARAVREGKFREDLYYRLNVFPITVPPLRDRQDDIPLLVWAFVKEFGENMGKTIVQIPKSSMSALQKYAWPGNIRELRNVIERAMIISLGSTLRVELPKVSDSTCLPGMTLEDMERKHITDVMKRTGWRVRGKGGAAEILGLKPTTLESRIKRLEIKRNR